MSDKDRRYYYAEQSEQFQFFKFPKVLITDATFSVVSMNAKVLYGLMLDRMSLSRKNNWIDEEGKVFIIYPVEEIMTDMHCSKQTAVNMLKELDKATGIGLIEKVRRGCGLPSILYVIDFTSFQTAEKEVDKSDITEENTRSLETRPLEVKNLDFKKSKNLTSRSLKTRPLEVKKLDPNKTNINKTDKVRVVMHPDPNQRSGPPDADDYKKIQKIWNATDGVVKIAKIEPGTKREGLLSDRIRQFDFDTVVQTIQKIPNSNYLKEMKVKFNWFLQPDNFIAVYEDTYAEAYAPPPNKQNAFHNFSQRTYDYDLLEEELYNSST